MELPRFDMGKPVEKATLPDLPPLSGYREAHPRVQGAPPVSATVRIFERKRMMIGFGIAAVLHVGLVLAWWLAPPLRLKAGYAPERWVQVMSLPKPAVEKAVIDKPPAPVSAPNPVPTPVKKKPHKRLHSTAGELT